MDAFLINLSEDRGERVLRDPNAVRTAIAQALDGPSRQLALDDAWAGLHFVLTGEHPIPRQKAEELGLSWDEGSLDNALMGGAATPYRTALGPARYLSPALVGLMSEELAAISLADFRDRFDADALAEEHIPPENWDGSVEELNWLLAYFEKLKNFYHDTAERGGGILVYFV